MDSLARQQEDGLFEGLSPPRDSQRGFLTSGMSLENTIKDMYKQAESKHPFDRGVGSQLSLFRQSLCTLPGKTSNFTSCNLSFIMKYVRGLSFLFALLYSELCSRGTGFICRER